MGGHKLILVCGFIALLGVLDNTASAIDWTAYTTNKEIVFIANASIQAYATYDVTTGGTKVGNYHFYPDQNTTVKATANDTVLNVTISNGDDQQSLKLTFVKNAKDYYLDQVEYVFNLTEKIYPKAKDSNAVISATIKKAENVFITALNNSYSCSLDMEIELISNATVKHHTWFKMGGGPLQLQAFTNNQTKFGKPQPCFSDAPRNTTAVSWAVVDSKNVTCARIVTTGYLNVTYKQISGKPRTTMIPFPKSGIPVTGMCTDTSISASFELDSGVNLGMNFTLRDVKRSFYLAKQQEYSVTGINVTFDTKNEYFQNHPISDEMVMISNTSLDEFVTPKNQSYKCDASSSISISPNLPMPVVTLAKTQLQAFDTPDKFGPASDCAATTPQPVTTPKPDPVDPLVYNWIAKDDQNNTCFTATAGFQFRASYVKSNDNSTEDVFFDFSNGTTKLHATNCSGNSFEVKLNDTKRHQLLTLTFKKSTQSDKTQIFALAAVQLDFKIEKEMFVNATDEGQNATAHEVYASMQFMPTTIGSYYSCSMETQVSLASDNKTNNITNVFVRIHGIKSLQAFPISGKNPKLEKCYIDQPLINPTEGDWMIKSKNKTCARIKSIMTLDVSYYDIMKKVISRKIPIDGKKVAVLSSECKENTTTLMLDVYNNKMINVTLQFNKIKASGYFAAPDDMEYVLDDVTLSYDTDNGNFQNHYGYGIMKTSAVKDLNLYPTPVGHSYKCDLTQQADIVNISKSSNMQAALAVTFHSAQWEPFGVNTTGDFSQAKYCAAEVSTIAPTTPHETTIVPPILPRDPTSYMFKVEDPKANGTVCLKANMGLQLRTTYKVSKGEQVIGFNFYDNTTTHNGSLCNNSNSSTVVFALPEEQIRVTLMFTKNTTTNTTYLSGVNVAYNITEKYFKDAKNANKSMNFDLTNIKELQTPLMSSYNCSDETDIVVNATNKVILRLTGIQLQAFDVKKNKFSKSDACFADKRPKTASTGNWTVANNGTKKACARYMFSATVNITYPTLSGKKNTVMIPIDNSSQPLGYCMPNVSSLTLAMDDKKLIFVFLFNKSDNSNYNMFDVHVHYDPTSKYFPNYDIIGHNDTQDFGNGSLNLFSSDVDHSYKCSAQVSVSLDGTNYMNISDVQVQPFGVSDEGGFSAVKKCATDERKVYSGAEIAVTVLCGILFVVVTMALVVYVTKKCKQKSGYHALY
ncbi:uncharacterized protein LOC143449826 isoform X2 [Clavelina lepadiformis]|uniref:uncharacterized protein LOC143449826 isoform X2 n=1 Tax=Clavelina lepadiformis TaxID=159417 RepID=UPI0040432609